MRKVLNYSLFVSFVITIMVPITGVHVHKLASTLFLLFSFMHTMVYREKLNAKRWGLLLLIVIAFVSGVFGMIFDHIPIVLNLHRFISITIVFFLAIHSYVFHKKIGIPL